MAQFLAKMPMISCGTKFQQRWTNKRRQNSNWMQDCRLISVWNLSSRRFWQWFSWECPYKKRKCHCSVRGILTCWGNSPSSSCRLIKTFAARCRGPGSLSACSNGNWNADTNEHGEYLNEQCQIKEKGKIKHKEPAQHQLGPAWPNWCWLHGGAFLQVRCKPICRN